MSLRLLAAAVDLLRDAAQRHGALINEDVVRHELGAIAFSRAELVEYLTSVNVYKLLSVTCSNHVEKVWAEVGHLADASIPKQMAAAASADEDLLAASFDAAPQQHVTSGKAPTMSLAYDLEEMSGDKRATALHFTNTAEERARREANLAVPTAAPAPPAPSEELLSFADAVIAMRYLSHCASPGTASSAGVADKVAPPPDAGTRMPPPPDASVPPTDADMGTSPPDASTCEPPALGKDALPPPDARIELQRAFEGQLEKGIDFHNDAVRTAAELLAAGDEDGARSALTNGLMHIAPSSGSTP